MYLTEFKDIVMGRMVKGRSALHADGPGLNPLASPVSPGEQVLEMIFSPPETLENTASQSRRCRVRWINGSFVRSQ